MRIAVICSSDLLGFPIIHHLLSKGMLSGVGILERNRKLLYKPLLELPVPASSFCFFKKENWKEIMHQWLEETKSTCVWVIGFPWTIPPSLLSQPAQGFYNFHFGLTPAYKGADPIFWQLTNRENTVGFVIHKMTETVDNGPVVWRERIPAIPGETYGLHCRRMGMVAVQALEKFIHGLLTDTLTEESASREEVLHFQKPDSSNLTIRWKQQSAEEIEWLVNACNPKYGGASTVLRGQEARILEVTPIDVNNSIDVEPGTIVHADATYGLIAACLNRSFIRINILSMTEGYLSGVKLSAMGIKAGEKFG